MTIYQQRPDTIDAVLIVNPNKPGDPPFQPPVPQWATDGIAQNTIRWVYDEAANQTTVTVYYADTDTPRLLAYTDQYLAYHTVDGAIIMLTQQQLDQQWVKPQ